MYANITIGAGVGFGIVASMLHMIVCPEMFENKDYKPRRHLDLEAIDKYAMKKIVNTLNPIRDDTVGKYFKTDAPYKYLIREIENNRNHNTFHGADFETCTPYEYMMRYFSQL